MKIPSTLPITAEQSRAARFQLGLTQANVIEQSNLPGHKLKNFETGRFVPDMPFLEALRNFYAGKGIDLSESDADTANASAPGAPPAQIKGGEMVRPVARMCFFVSEQIDPEVVDQLLGRMDANDERIAAIMQTPVQKGFFGGLDEETEQKQRELFGAMSENYLLFRILQGRNIVSPKAPGDEPATHADLVNAFYASSPMAITTARHVASDETESEGGEV